MQAVTLENMDVQIGRKHILHHIDFTINKGQFFGLIGPNGSGKSTLLKTIANIQTHRNGHILLHEKQQHTFTPKQLAKMISYVPQETDVGFDFLVRDVIQMGRHVYGTLFKSETKKDEEMIEWAMEQTDTTALQNESIRHLSGGQRQLVMIAKALAQDTPILLLDEPISALDVHYQLKILTMLQKLSKQGKTIVIVLHDLNLAARFCRTLLLLNEGKVQKIGTPEEVLTAPLLKNIYHIDARIRKDEEINRVTITPYIEEIESNV